MFFKLLKKRVNLSKYDRRILFTISLFWIFRIGTTITVPGVNAKSLEALVVYLS